MRTPKLLQEQAQANRLKLWGQYAAPWWLQRRRSHSGRSLQRDYYALHHNKTERLRHRPGTFAPDDGDAGWGPHPQRTAHNGFSCHFPVTADERTHINILIADGEHQETKCLSEMFGNFISNVLWTGEQTFFFSSKNKSIHLMKEVNAIGKNLNELLNCTKSLNDRMIQNVNLHRCWCYPVLVHPDCSSSFS